MRLSALATTGYERPANLVHILLDNEIHESMGGQATVSHSVDLAAIAQACGYPRVVRAGALDEVAAALNEAGEELTFIHVKTAPGGIKTGVRLLAPLLYTWLPVTLTVAWLTPGTLGAVGRQGSLTEWRAAQLSIVLAGLTAMAAYMLVL